MSRNQKIWMGIRQIGQYSIQEQLIAMDGNLIIESAPETGTVVTAILSTALG